MNIFGEFLNRNSGLWEIVGFYTFFLGILIMVAIIVPLLFEKERWLLPSIIISLILIGFMAYALEKKGPLIPDFNESPRIVYLTKIVEVPAPAPPAIILPTPEKKTEKPKPRKPEKSTTTPKKAKPSPTRTPKPKPVIAPVKPERVEPTPTPRPKPELKKAEPKPQPEPKPEPEKAEPKPQPKNTVARVEEPPPAPTPKRTPPTGERTDEGLVLPTGTLVIKITSTLLMVVPKEASKAIMSIYVDGKYVGGKRASSLKKQTDGDGNILNVTYFWKGVTIRLTNWTTGNHRVSIKLKVTGHGVSKSKTSWSGNVYVGKNSTTTVVLEGGWGPTLSRIQ